MVFLKVSNLRNGLYPTLSKNGIVQGCASVGSLDSGLWVAGSEQVHVLDNTLSDSITGLEVTVFKDLYIANNNVFNNVVGIGMYHANMAGTFPDFLPSNWVIENNRVFNNNRVNDAPAGTFQAALPNGYGILMVGVRDVTIMNNIIVGNKNVGLSMAGFCEVQQLVFQADCTTGSNAPIDGDPSANDNTIVGNIFDSNGEIGLPALNLPGADIAYVQSAVGFLKPNNNCFENNISPYGNPASFFATDFDRQLGMHQHSSTNLVMRMDLKQGPPRAERNLSVLQEKKEAQITILIALLVLLLYNIGGCCCSALVMCSGINKAFFPSGTSSTT